MTADEPKTLQEAIPYFSGGKARNMHFEKRKRVITGTGGKDKTAVMGILQRNGAASAANSHKVVSLFSGCGGLDLGFSGDFKIFGKKYAANPFNIEWANDINAAAVKSYKKNLSDHIHHGDVWEALDSMPKKADVVIGGFPCRALRFLTS